FELIRKYQVILAKERPGFGNICVHKGFAPPPHDAAHDNPENGNPEDLPNASRAWPTFNFIIYHSCIRPVLFYNPKPLANLLSRKPVLREGVPNIEWTTRFAQISRDLHNVYAEVGSTFASTVITFPTVWAHIIGQLLQNMGSRRVVFESRIPSDLRHVLEFPGFSSDNISKMRQRYLAEGATPDHRRYGWIRTLV